MTKGFSLDVYEKINYLLTEKNMTKKQFADKLIELSPKLKSTGEIPSSQTILGYLYGKREIKIELIPYKSFLVLIWSTLAITTTVNQKRCES